jgi:hypothetical protein
VIGNLANNNLICYFYKNEIMNVHILRSTEYPIEDFNQVVNLLKTHTNSIKIKGHSNVKINYENDSDIKHWDEFFKISNHFRSAKKVNENDYVFLLTEFKNQEDYFGWTDETLGNYFIQTSDWNHYFESEVNKHFPISYEVVAWILRSLMYDTQEEIIKNAHVRARGCVMDFCDEKDEIILKMRTGDVCNSCLNRINDRGVNPGFLGNIFNTMENIRKGLMYRERNELLGTVSPIKINLGEKSPKFVLTEMNNLEFDFDDGQTAIYMTIIELGGLNAKCLADYEDDILFNYLRIKHKPQFENKLQPLVREWVNPMNTSLFTQKVSKINKKLKVLLGETLATPYLVTNEKGTYKIKLPMNKVRIL